MSGINLYMSQYNGGRPALTSVINAKTIDPSGYVGITKNFNAVTTGGAFWCKISGNGKVIWYMPENRNLYCGLLNSATGDVTSDIQVYSNGQNFNPNMALSQFAVSYDGTQFMASSFNSGTNNGFICVAVTINGTTITVNNNKTISSGNGVLRIHANNPNLLGKSDISASMIEAIAMSNNPTNPYLLFGTFNTSAHSSTSITNYTQTILFAKDYTDISTNQAGLNNEITFKSPVKTMSIDLSYCVGVSISPTRQAAFLLTVNKMDSYSGYDTTGGGSLYRIGNPP
jgi:hypothetical protein